ncbi:hypothetical protein, partial [Escherichia coli]|uniref:hypothetical protein n=1 Tax=Escherichia coli TaxID=562 RepID=UPI001950C537
MPDALRLSGLLGELQYIEFARSCRPDKAFTPHPTSIPDATLAASYQAYLNRWLIFQTLHTRY